MSLLEFAFDVNQTEFANDYQREVWKLGIHIVPLDISIADITDLAMREGCTQVYQCTMEMLTDMFNNTTEYSMTRPLDYIEFVFTWVTGKRRVPVSISKRKRFYEHILNKIQKFGFVFDGGELANARYPSFMQYWTLLQEHGIPPHLCNFRVFAPTYKRARTLDDLLRPLPDQIKVYFTELYNYALTKGAKRLSYNPYKLYYFVHKKKHVLGFDNHSVTAVVPYMNQYTSGDVDSELQRFITIAQQQHDGAELIAYIQKEITFCADCGNKNCNGHIVDVAGVKCRAACCRSEIGKAHRPADKRGFTDYDVAMLKRMIDVRFLQIENQNKGVG